MARWRAAQVQEAGGQRERRPYLASECNDLPQAEKWRLQIVREIAKKVAQIQNGKFNFKINKLSICAYLKSTVDIKLLYFCLLNLVLCLSFLLSWQIIVIIFTAYNNYLNKKDVNWQNISKKLVYLNLLGNFIYYSTQTVNINWIFQFCFFFHKSMRSWLLQNINNQICNFFCEIC